MGEGWVGVTSPLGLRSSTTITPPLTPPHQGEGKRDCAASQRRYPFPPRGRDMASITEPTDHQPWPMKRVVAASSAGTAFEWYDFFIFGSLATTIQKVFFAGLDPTAGLVAALALFAAGFAFRPLGAIIFGVIGDRVGRKGAFLATVSLMGGATFLIGLLPTYAQAGALAPSLLIMLRIL